MKAHTFLVTAITISFLLIVSGCGSIGTGRDTIVDESGLSRSDAQQVAETAINRSYQYVEHNGHDLTRLEYGRGREGAHIFSYRFDVDNAELGDWIEGFSARVIVRDEDDLEITFEEIIS